MSALCTKVSKWTNWRRMGWDVLPEWRFHKWIQIRMEHIRVQLGRWEYRGGVRNYALRMAHGTCALLDPT